MDFTQYLHSVSRPFSTHPVIQKPSIPFTTLILSPHPDDECIVGSLALRLMHENNAQVINIAITLGSNKKRQKERLKELKNACEHLEFELDVLSEDWKVKVKELKSLIQKYQPDLIIAPHINDKHPTHIKTGKLLLQALKGIKQTTLVARSEFWHPMEKPNLLIEVPLDIVALQMQALAMHIGEVERNPYHLRLPSWMIDNIRRGGEMMANVGGVVPKEAFGVIYQLQKSKSGKLTNVKLESPYLNSLADIAQIFKEI